MGKKGKKAQAGKPKKLTPKDVGKRLDALVKKLGEELKDADLFAQLPPTEDCAICFVPLSRLKSGTLYQTCCGNQIRWACYRENKASINKRNEKNAGKKDKKPIVFTCPFCREPEPGSGPEYVRKLQARCLQKDQNALSIMGDVYRTGEHETLRDELKTLDCWIQAVELGDAVACVQIGVIYDRGDGVAVNKERLALFQRAGALRGDICAHNYIGLHEYRDLGNHEIGIRHWKIAAEAGMQISLTKLRNIYNADGKLPGKEFITKEYLDFAYRACHGAQLEVKSEERDKHSTDESKKFKC